MFEVGEFLIAEAGGLAQWAGSAHPADCRVLIGESALESHHDVAAIFHVIGDALEQCIVCDVEGGDDEELVGGEVCSRGKDKIGPMLSS